MQTQPTNSIQTLSDDEDEYLDTCPIYHDVDSQSIYGFDVIQHPLRKSDEILWKDRELNSQLKFAHFNQLFFIMFQLITSFKFQNQRQPSQRKV